MLITILKTIFIFTAMIIVATNAIYAADRGTLSSALANGIVFLAFVMLITK